MATFVIAVLACAGFAAQAQAATYTAAGGDGSTTPCPNPASGTCTLRQLILYENALPSAPNPADTITVPAGTYDLAHGALVVTQSMAITGAGARTTTVDRAAGAPADRIFDVQLPAGGAAPTVVISGLKITGGNASRLNGFYGGDIRNQATLTLVEDWITGGTTTFGSGGGVSNDAGTLAVERSLITGNQGGNDSGGIQNFGVPGTTDKPGHLVVDNSTIAGNSSSQGGGIMSWNDATNTTLVTNSTIAHNDGGPRNAGGGGLLATLGSISVQNSIVAFNTVDTPNAGTASNCGTAGPNGQSGTITSLDFNIENGTDCGFTQVDDRQSTDPLFTSNTPQNNGGNTDTLGLNMTSLAVDAIPANNPTCGGTDQRDVVRPFGAGCDIGAYEFVPAITATEGAQFSGQVAQPTDCFVQTAMIDWGDGTQSAGTVDPNHRIISGTHVYGEEGTFKGTATYRGDCASSSYTFQARVTDAMLNATPVGVNATAGVPFSGRVAVFSDTDPDGIPSDYSATINWGDGSQSAGTINAVNGGFSVTGSHTYATHGTYPTAITITDVGGASASANGSATVNQMPSATVAPPSVTPTSAAFAGQINPEGSATNAHWEYGLDPSDRGPGFSGNVFDQSTPSQFVGADASTHAISTLVRNLQPNTRYHVRLVASNAVGTTFGPDQVFTTPPAPSPPAPVLGKTENLTPIGTVFVQLNGKFVKLTQSLQLPTGTVVDALHGSVSLVVAGAGNGKATDARAKKGKKKTVKFTGTFGGAVFKTSQTKSGPNKGLLTLTLVDGAFPGAPTYASCKAKGAADAHTALSRRVLQTLRSRASGRFRTRGRYAAGTVLGTQWSTTDRCDGTLIAVQQHSVLVTDLVKHITVLVRQGHNYLAKAPTRKHR